MTHLDPAIRSALVGLVGIKKLEEVLILARELEDEFKMIVKYSDEIQQNQV